MTKPLKLPPRHTYDENDASYELARYIGQFIDDAPTLLADWRVWTATPAHLLRFKNIPCFVVFPKSVWVVPPDYKTNKLLVDIGLLASSPDFFELLLRAMTEISGQSTNVIKGYKG